MPTQTHTVTIAQALASSMSGLLVQDSAAAIAGALPTPGLVMRVASFTVSAPAVLTMPQFLALSGLGTTLHAAAGSLTLNSAVTVTAAQLTAMESVPGFTMGSGASVTLSDTVSAVTGLLATHSAWSMQLAGIAVQLDGTSIGAYPATLLNNFASHGKPLTFIPGPGHTTLNVAAAAHDLGSNVVSLDALAARAPVSFTLTNEGATVIAADAAGLAMLTGFSPAAHTLTVTDTAANIASHAGVLFGAGFTSIQVQSGTFAGTAPQLTDPTLHLLSGAHAQLAATATTSGQAAAALAALPGFSLATGTHLSVTDTAANLAATAPSWLAFASAATLGANAIVPAATAAGLGQIVTALGAGFSLGGHSLTVNDTLPALLALPAQVAMLATGLVLDAPATASVAQVSAFAALPHAITGGFPITVSDTASNLLGLSGAALADAAGTALSANATVSAAAFAALRALPAFGLGGHSLVVSDTLSGLLTVPSQAALLATGLVLAAPATASVAQVAAFAALPNVTTGGFPIAVVDTAANLQGLSGAALADVASTALSADATVSASGLAALRALPSFGPGGHSLVVSDTLPALLALPAQVAMLATGLMLDAPATASVAQVSAFAALPNATTGGFPITVSDTASNLLGLSGAALADAAGTALSANATVSASGFAALRALPAIGLGGHVLSIADTAANLAGLTGSLALASAETLTANAQVGAAQVTALAGLPAFSLAGHVLTVSDTAPALLALSPASLALANAVVLSADATVTAPQAVALMAEAGFSTGGHHLTIADNAANLLALPLAAQVDATTLALAGSQSVTAAQLTQLASLGIKFSEAGATLVCADSAASLAALSPAALALASAEVLAAPATVTAATAASLAALPALFEAPGAALTIQDSVTNLIAMGAEPAITGLVQLAPGSFVTVSAWQAHALALVPHFAAGSASITVSDSVAALTSLADAGWQAVAGTVQVIDSAADLAAAAGTALVQNAASVILSSNAQVNAGAAAQIASIPHFSPGAFALTVVDTAAAIAANAGAIDSVAAGAVVTDSGPVSTSVADQLAVVSAAGKLSFLGGDQLLVQDSYAALTAPANAAGVALAARLGVLDSAANLVTAAGHDWGALNPSYTLTVGGVITAAQAQTLAGLGSHFSAAGHALHVDDAAAPVAWAAGALAALGITASVYDTAANLGAYASALQALGNEVYHVHVTDLAAVSAASAAALAPLAGKLVGPPLVVADNAADVDSSLAGLTALGSHVSIIVDDSAADIAVLAGDLATLGQTLVIHLTDSAPVTAAVAAGLQPVAGQISGSLALSVSDTGAAIAAHAAGLLALGNELGQLTVLDGPTQSAAVAAALAPLDSHLPPGLMITAYGSGADISANEAGLLQLANDGHLAAVVVDATSVADALGNEAALNTLSAQVGVYDSAAAVDGALGGLAGLSGLTAIALTDAGTPALGMSVATLAADAGVLAKITTPYTIAIDDTAANIAADLASGASSAIASHAGQIGGMVTSDGQPVVLSQAQVLAAGVDDGASSALAHFIGTLKVSGVDVGHLAQVLGLATAPASVTVSDTGAALSADLAQGSGSVLVGHAGQVTQVISSDGAPVVLTATQALAAGVDDSAVSPLGELSGAPLLVTDAAVSQLAGLAGLHLQPQLIEIRDTAADISADLASPNSALIAFNPSIDVIFVTDGLPINLTEAQVLAPQVDDGFFPGEGPGFFPGGGPGFFLGSVLSKIPDVQLTVSGVAAGDLGEVFGLQVAPQSVSITDTAAHLLSALPVVTTDIGRISSITLTGGPLVLTAGEALSAHVDDGAGSVIDRLSGHVFDVTGAAVAQLAPLAALGDAPAAIAVSDSSTDIVADLVSSASSLMAQLSTISQITVTHGTLTLTDTQADTILNTPSLDAVFAKLAPATVVSVTGVPVADLSAIAQSGWPHVTVAVADTAEAVANDLESGNSSLVANSLMLGSVTLDAAGTVSAAALADMAGMPHFSTAGYPLVVSDGAAAIAGIPAPALQFATAVQVVDTDTNVAAQLDALQAKFDGALSITLSDPSPEITLTAAQYQADRPTIDAITNNGLVNVTGSAAALAPIAAELGADAVVFAVAVTDSAMDVVANLATLQQAGGKLVVTLTDTTLSAALVAPLLSIGGLNASIPVVDTGSQIAAVVESGNTAAIAYLNAHGATLSATSAVTAVDAAALESLGGFSKGGHLLEVWDSAAHLTSPAYALALANSALDGVYLKAPGGVVSVTAASAATLFNIAGFHTQNPDGSSNVLNVSDTVTHIEAVLGALSGNRSQIGTITVNATAIVTEQVLGDLQGLGAVASGAATITMRDTAAAIADEVGQVGPHSIMAASYVLSGNGTVSEAQAVLLGNLANFTTGGYTVTLNLGGDTVISLADANALGNLAGALNLGGHHLIVDGTVAQLATLSPAALGLVTPALADSFANIAALPASSPLLGGTVEVTGSDPLTASAVSGFLALVHTGAGQGIAAGSLTFDSTHLVTDTVANLQALTSGAGWTGNAATHGDFALMARDSAANLINPANTAYLSGLSQTGLAGYGTISAATATSLANVANTIHFVHDHAITVSDSAANVLNPANSAGIGLADGITLAGPATVDAADAESLIGMSHFYLSAPLVISDSSANLLDGVLGQDIASSGYANDIEVHLAGPETLDADTAESLVSLPRFADTVNITVADASSYLLNGANLTAEQMAASVTLAGDETVSANTVLRLSEVPHFTPGSSHLVLAGNDFADAATLKAIADDGTAFQSAGHTITLMQDAPDLTPGEYNALHSDIVNANGHAIGITPTAGAVTDSGAVLSVSATGIAGGTVHVYAQDGTPVGGFTSSSAGFTVSVPDTAPGHNFEITETVGGVEGAPLVVLDAGALENVVASTGAVFASSGQIQIDPGKFINLYEAGSVPALTHPALVYDPVAHTVSLDLPNGGVVPLITLGGTTHPSSLDLAEILIKHHG